MRSINALMHHRRIQQVLKSDWSKIAALVLSWRTLIFLLSLFASTKMAFNPAVQASQHPGPQTLQSSARWDSAYYIDIATKGYTNSPTQPYVAFFPLFPLIVFMVSRLGVSVLVAGAIINTLAVYAASYLLLLLANDYFKDKKLAYRALLLFLFSPAAYFLAAFYTEALFCALIFGAIWYARKQKWFLASLLAALVTATRLPGILVLLVIGVEYLASHQYNIKKFSWNVLWLLMAPAGIFAYILFLHYKTGDTLSFMHVTKIYWPYHQLTPNIFSTIYNQAHIIWRVLRNPKFSDIQYLYDTSIPFAGWLITLAATIWIAIKKLPLSYLVLGIASLILFTINGNFVSDHRYLIFFFPIYLMIVSATKNETVYSLFLAASASSMAVMLAAFANSYWTG